MEGYYMVEDMTANTKEITSKGIHLMTQILLHYESFPNPDEIINLKQKYIY